jgi:hypothetical protein
MRGQPTSSLLRRSANARGRLSYALRQQFDYILLPLDENDHAEAYGFYNVIMRHDAPLRSGELGQFNLDDGLSCESDDDGTEFSIFTALPKYSPLKRDYVPSPLAERLVEEFLETTSRRRLKGQLLGPVARPTRVEKGPEVSTFVLSYGEKALSLRQLNVATTMFLAGICQVRPHDHKYLWNRMRKLAGARIEDMQQEQGHVLPHTTIHYKPLTKGDRSSHRQMIHKFFRDRPNGKAGSEVQDDG